MEGRSTKSVREIILELCKDYKMSIIFNDKMSHNDNGEFSKTDHIQCECIGNVLYSMSSISDALFEVPQQSTSAPPLANTFVLDSLCPCFL